MYVVGQISSKIYSRVHVVCSSEFKCLNSEGAGKGQF